MKFIKGLFVGTLIGFALGSALTEEQRSALRNRTEPIIRKQSRRVGDAVTRQADEIAGSAADRVVGTVDKAGEKVSSAIEPDSGSGIATAS